MAKANRDLFRHAAGPDSNADKKYLFDISKDVKAMGDKGNCSASAKYFCMHMSGGGGPCLIVDFTKPGRKSKPDQHLLEYHSSAVLASEWSPHSDNLLASGDDGGQVFIKFFEDDMFTEEGLMKQKCEKDVEGKWGYTMKLNTGFRKGVSSLAWHPTIKNLLAVASKEKAIKFFDVTTGEETSFEPIATPHIPISVCWSWDGKRLACVAKTDGGETILTYNLSPSGLTEAMNNKMKGFSRSSVCWMNDEEEANQRLLVMTRDSNGRYFILFDMEGNQTLKCNVPESGATQLIPYYDAGRKIIYYWSVGSTSVSWARFIVAHKGKEDRIKSVSIYRNPNPSPGIKAACMINPRACDVMECEINRFISVTAGSKCTIRPTPIIVPRKNKDSFVEALFPKIPGRKPACTLEDYLAGKVEGALWPNMISQDPDVKISEDGEEVFETKMSYADLEKRCAQLEELLKANGVEVPPMEG